MAKATIDLTEQVTALNDLREVIEKSDGIVYSILRWVNRNGDSRVIDSIVIVNGRPRSISWLYAKASGMKFDSKRKGVHVGGGGMDMGFALTYDISRKLWPEGYPCTGERCDSNDHCNGDRDYTPGHVVHRDGGYRLTHRWL